MSEDCAALHPCPWAKGEDYLAYHDNEWGVPSYDRNHLFEKLCLEGQQAGLSWITVLRKRDHYRRCFHHFVPESVARMRDSTLEKCLTDTGLIRNRLKIYAIRTNARALLTLEQQGTDFVEFLWQFVGGKPLINRFTGMADVPAQTEAARAMSKALKKAGFTFVGPTICYAFMQSMGLVNDHLTSCPQHPDNQQ
ncbi:MAG: DNA-3-methyladenine glycosylase I [Oceanospirillaceae bacterium]|nr:DNA-3-methyladenine glycosylase I [Oceanospirillaceae bacterium]MBT13533.1 DNA-3-methyladenine glycosylase I [Oceanospirillaceae bacterium]|tara:strand:+ start:90708 stop:91289 length:582 start_codon:yes stop_codon:yes gene_type:complete